MTKPVSLNQQIEAVGFAVERQARLVSGHSIKALRGRTVEEFDLERLQAAVRTLRWLEGREDELRAFMALPPATREAGLAMAAEIARKQAFAAAGGPVR